MSKNRSKKSHNYLLICLILLCSCSVKEMILGLQPSPTSTLPPDLMDQSWLTDQPCRAPCWYGLSLGTTSKSDAQEKVLQLPFIDSKSVIDKDIGISSFYCKQPNQRICTILYFYEDHLDRIGLVPNFKVNLKEVVGILNPPDFLSYRPITPDKMFGRDCQIELYWVERQMTIRYYNDDNNNMCKVIKNSGNKPSPTLPIQEVWYLMPEYFMDRNVEDGYYPWTGFAEEK